MRARPRPTDPPLRWPGITLMLAVAVALCACGDDPVDDKDAIALPTDTGGNLSTFIVHSIYFLI